jgi:hypothetical protein
VDKEAEVPGGRPEADRDARRSGSGGPEYVEVRDGTRVSTRVITTIVVTALVAFLVGFGWQYMRAQGISGELDETRRELAVSRMEATLGAAAIEAQRGSYEVSRQLTSSFFTSLQADMSRTPDRARNELTAIQTQRDGLITALSRGDPAASELLVRTFLQFRTAIHGPDQAAPAANQPPASGEPGSD